MFLFLFVFLVVKTQVITASSFLKVIVLVNNRYLEQLVILMMGCLCFTVKSVLCKFKRCQIQITPTLKDLQIYISVK